MGKSFRILPTMSPTATPTATKRRWRRSTEDGQRLPEVNLMQSNSPGAFVQEEGLLKETSNVDLAEEFPQMMIAQRGYEANIKALKAQSDVLKSLLDITV